MKKRIHTDIVHFTPHSGCLGGKVAFVSGGTGGIGSEIVRDLVASGCRVVVASTSKQKFDRTFGRSAIGALAWQHLDMRLPNQNWDEFVNSVRSAYGVLPNLWVFAAGVHSPKTDLTFQNAVEDDYDSVVGIDLDATLGLALATARAMVCDHAPARMVIVSSSTGGEPAWSPYRVAKWGCNAFVSEVAQKLLPYGIGIWSVCPGPCATRLLGYGEGQPIGTHDMQQGRYVMPEEVAPYVISLLASKTLSGSGQSVYVSGGRGAFDIR